MIKKQFKNISSVFALIMTINLTSGTIQLSSNDQLSIPLPLPYNGSIYSEDDVKDFMDSTIKQSKQPVIIFGGNWCPDCRIFAGTMNIPKIKAYIEEKFNVLYIDVKRYEINMHLMEEYGIPSAEGIPRLLVFDKEKNLLNNSRTAEWRTARDRSSQEIFDFFQEITVN